MLFIRIFMRLIRREAGAHAPFEASNRFVVNKVSNKLLSRILVVRGTFEKDQLISRDQ